ncbi:cytochrome P450, partial [Nocardia asiatica]|uniref:cytochrome P450 n=1 Tax=Nocardia asiatica TaxID=209252 RepID=UPI002458BD98
MSHAPISLRELPRLRTRDLAQIGGLMRPGTHRSPLLELGERFVVAPPGFPAMLVTHNMSDVRELFANHDDFSVGQVLSRFSSHDMMFGKQTLIFLDGDEHRRERKLFAPPFQSKALRSYEDLMVEVVRRELPNWPVDEPFEFLKVGYDLAIGVLLGVVFGDVAAPRKDRLKQAVSRWFGEIESRGFLAVTLLTPLVGGYTLPYPPLRRRQAEVDAVIIEEIAARGGAPAPRGANGPAATRGPRPTRAGGAGRQLAADLADRYPARTTALAEPPAGSDLLPVLGDSGPPLIGHSLRVYT